MQEREREHFGWGDVSSGPPPGSLRSPTSPQGPQGGGESFTVAGGFEFHFGFPSKNFSALVEMLAPYPAGTKKAARKAASGEAFGPQFLMLAPMGIWVKWRLDRLGSRVWPKFILTLVRPPLFNLDLDRRGPSFEFPRDTEHHPAIFHHGRRRRCAPKPARLDEQLIDLGLGREVHTLLMRVVPGTFLQRGKFLWHLENSTWSGANAPRSHDRFGSLFRHYLYGCGHRPRRGRKVQKLFGPLLAISALLALLPFIKLAMSGPINDPILLAIPWFLCVLAALVIYRRRGLWFLAGAPVVLGPAILIFTYLARCIPSKSCL
jgi:hypothetical protein